MAFWIPGLVGGLFVFGLFLSMVSSRPRAGR
jgi:hypothetical protein